jgi:DNA-binding NarL/FixJ family response regulator
MKELDELEKATLRLTIRGFRVKEIAWETGNSYQEIQNKVRSIYRKTKSESMAQVIAKLSGFTI